jgi:hypothetical protein
LLSEFLSVLRPEQARAIEAMAPSRLLRQTNGNFSVVDTYRVVGVCIDGPEAIAHRRSSHSVTVRWFYVYFFLASLRQDGNSR